MDLGACGNACCVGEVNVSASSVYDAYMALSSYLNSSGGDGLYAKGSDTDEAGNQSPDDQGDYPFLFHPSLPWRYTTSGTHTTNGLGYIDQLRFSVGVQAAGARVRLFSMSAINGALGDNGQNYKNLAYLLEGLSWPTMKILYGCGKDPK